jgi:hypothetical protein
MSKVIQNKGGIGVGAPYDIPGYEYDPVTDKFKDLATGKTFDKDGNAKLEDNKSFTVDTNGTIIVNPSATYDGMKKVTLSVEVAGGDLEDNKNATIDVSAYTDPVEVTPTQGKDGMKKVTVSLSNIPAGANMLYAWEMSSNVVCYLDVGVATTTGNDIKMLNIQQNRSIVINSLLFEGDVYAKVSDTEFTVSYESSGETVTETFTRDPTKDVEVWNAPPEVETTKQATIDVSTYDPANKPVITPTAGKQSMAEVEITLSNIPSGGGGNVYCAYDAPMSDSDIVPDGEYVGTTIFDPDLGNRIFTIIGDGVKTVKELMTEMGGSSDYSWTYFITCTNVIVNEQEYAYEKLHLYYGYSG